MRLLRSAMERFLLRHPNFGIPNLTRIYIVGTAIVFILTMFSSASAVAFLRLNFSAVLRGEVWRLVTFLFVSGTGFGSGFGMFFFAIYLYFCYFIGTTLERTWGTGRFTMYCLIGYVLTILSSALVYALTGSGYGADAGYLFASMFLAVATLYPENRVLLFYIIPIKMKYLAFIGLAWIALQVILSALRLNLLGVLLPIAGIFNYLLFFGETLMELVRGGAGRVRYRADPKVIRFRDAQKKAQQRPSLERKCAVCGRTEESNPELTFRFCSKCAGYHCFCEDHIFSHVHFTEE